MLRRVAICCSLVLIVGNAKAVDFGWEQLEDGGIEFIVQVRPAQLDAFRSEGFSSTIPSGAVRIRRVRLVVGEGLLPNQGVLPPLVADSEPPAPEASPSDVAAGDAAPETGNSREPGNLAVEGARPLGPFGGGYFNDPQRNNEVEPTGAKTPDDDLAESEPETAGGDATDEPIPAQPQIAGKPSTEDADAGKASSEPRPWMPLTLALVALFISLGANAYLAWIHQTLRASYRVLLARINRGTAIA